MRRRDFLGYSLILSVAGWKLWAQSEREAQALKRKSVPETAIEIGSERQLFVDHFLIASKQGLTLRLHPPMRREVVLTLDRPWEGDTSTYPVVIKDGGLYRMWYQAGLGHVDRLESGTDTSTGYAESRDGIRWERPSLGLIDFRGSKENNLVWPGERGKNFSVIKDLNPRIPENERYKSILQAPYQEGLSRSAIYGVVSPDGLHWRLAQQEPLIPDLKEEYAADGPHTLFWDPWESQYVVYRRGWWGENRSIRRSVSSDFRHWTHPEFVDISYETSPREQFYNSACTPYDRARGIYLMFPTRFIEERTFYSRWPFPGRPFPGQSDIAFLSSRDGIHWDRTFREAFIRPGLDPNNWHERCMYFGRASIVPTAPDELSMYLNEGLYTTANCIRRLTVRPDGFISVNASLLGGELITRPFIFSGHQLSINYSTSAMGSLRVGFLNSFGRPIGGRALADCGEVFGDELERVVTWKGESDVSGLVGESVRLQFAIRDADLYSFRFVE